ncbi:hypothetical protein COCCADRAFT_92376 [Bipolaris zeicola 26-R-13]|uniref:Peptidase A1 domain-containing protein n=1 Tax=Cochliobolus carbonum (strain 26-R-13) TaxID=930089 RepID=W6Y5T4_COCC2|nr:uncharacterized protein COCCADRAFT_92376 [Bipolaris zeicola 26-R-13]EUC34887.1 hypothetical protein COCCADRAFT_92376 [Bipolaris zeicola 26-R-13]
MFNPLCLATLPVLLCQATYLDPSLLQQKPLMHGLPSDTLSDVTVLPLTLNKHLHYTFSSPTNNPTPLSRLQNSAAVHATHHEHSRISIAIPLDAAHTGTISFSSPTSSAVQDTTATHMTWIPQNPWDVDMHDIPLLDAGVRKGGMVSMSVETAVLDFSTAFITLPAGLWDVVVLATQPVLKPSWGQERGQEVMSVECEARRRFPDLVLVMEDESEIVVGPKQYVLQRGDECVLLVKKAEEGDEERVGLGWAIARGREVVFDWGEGRIGLGAFEG